MKFKPGQKYALERLEKSGWVGKDSGFVTPCDGPTIGDYVWCGSISSRDGWFTTCVTWVSKDRMHFKTLNSEYRLTLLDEYYARKKVG